MAAGLPGTGVGGLFLILSALLMPLVELKRRVRGRSERAGWRPVGRHAALAIGMVIVVAGAIGAVHWALMGPSPTHNGVSARGAVSTPDVALMAPPVAPVLMTLALLACILAIAYTLRLILHGPRRLRARDVPSDTEQPRVTSRGSRVGRDTGKDLRGGSEADGPGYLGEQFETSPRSQRS
jgi:hypothetical protein